MKQELILRRISLVAVLLLGCLGVMAQGKVRAEDPKPKAPQQDVESARAASLKQVTFDIQYMSSDEMGGRQPGTPGIKLCEEYIISEYKKAGLKPLEDGTYLQELEVGAEERSVNKAATALVLKDPDGLELKLELGKDFQQLIGQKDFDLSSDLVFVGYGISAEEHNYDDFAGIDVQDKIVVLIRYEPQADDVNSVFDGKDPSDHARARAKVLAASTAGAAGILMVNDLRSAVDEEKDELIESERFGNNNLPFAQIKRNVFNKMLKLSPLVSPTGVKLENLQEVEALIDRNLEPISQQIEGWSANFKSSFNSNRTKTNNIIGIIEGEGPHADETIIIGGHYDHLGMGGGISSRAKGRIEIHNGADDNATGTAAILELARRFNKRDKKPGRRLVFICFTAEEMGLLGATHYCNNPIYPLEKTAAMVNFDMIGWLRDDKLWLYNWNSSPQLDPIFEASNEDFDFELVKPSQGFAGSDHLPFNLRRVPNMFIHTGLNSVYHTPEDDFEAINCAGALKVIDFSERVVDGLASLEKIPSFGTPRPIRLGVLLDDNNDVVTIEGVTPNSIAEKAGLQKGDIILEFGGEKVTKRRSVNLLIRRDSGKKVKLKLKRGDAEINLNVELKNEG